MQAGAQTSDVKAQAAGPAAAATATHAAAAATTASHAAAAATPTPAAAARPTGKGGAAAATDCGHLPAAPTVDPVTGRVEKPNKRCPCPNCKPPATAARPKGAGSFAANLQGQQQQQQGRQGQGQQGKQQQGRGNGKGNGKGSGAERKPSFNFKALPSKPLMAAPTTKQLEAESPKVGTGCVCASCPECQVLGGLHRGACGALPVLALTVPPCLLRVPPSRTCSLARNTLPTPLPQPKKPKESMKVKFQKLTARLIKRKKE